MSLNRRRNPEIQHEFVPRRRRFSQPVAVCAMKILLDYELMLKFFV